jgi:hypothetical protein
MKHYLHFYIRLRGIHIHRPTFIIIYNCVNNALQKNIRDGPAEQRLGFGSDNIPSVALEPIQDRLCIPDILVRETVTADFKAS